MIELSSEQASAVELQLKLVHLRNEQYVIASRLKLCGGVEGLQQILDSLPDDIKPTFDISNIEGLDLGFLDSWQG